ncbi:MAG: CBS domain-containing protein [Lentisphaerae bacterium]|nr:CBS domain-containing protein [Lentisphaerota bacterium]
MLTAADILREMPRDLVTTTPDTTVLEALQIMTKKNIGSILIVEGSRPVGIWTERDLMHNTVRPGFNAAATRIGDVMVRNLVYTPDSDTVYELADKILGRRHRRLLIQHDGAFIGLLTSGDVIRAFMRAKQRELEELNAMVGWEYYEEWRWTKESGKAKPATKA